MQLNLTRISNKKTVAITAFVIVIVSLALISAQVNFFQQSQSKPNNNSISDPNPNITSTTTANPTSPSSKTSTVPTPTTTATSHQTISPRPSPTPTETPAPDLESTEPTPTPSPTPTPMPTPTPSPTPSPTPTPTPKWTITINGNVNNPKTLTLTQIKALPATTITAALKSSGHPEENGVFQFSGASLLSVLQQAGVKDDASIVTIKSQDGFEASFMLNEINANSQKILLAYLKDGQPMNSITDGGEGPLRLMVGSDAFANRWVKGVSTIEVT